MNFQANRTPCTMQRCPYIHEMKERLLGQPGEMLMMEPVDSNKEVLEVTQDPQVGTIVKVNTEKPKRRNSTTTLPGEFNTLQLPVIIHLRLRFIHSRVPRLFSTGSVHNRVL